MYLISIFVCIQYFSMFLSLFICNVDYDIKKNAIRRGPYICFLRGVS